MRSITILACYVMFASPLACEADGPHPCERETVRLMTVKSSLAALYADGIALPDRCFDGYFAEGISDTIVRKMVADWSGFESLLEEHKGNKKFFRLVLRSINATLNSDDIKAVGNKAKNSCSPGLQKECAAIRKRAGAALAEIAQVLKSGT